MLSVSLLLNTLYAEIRNFCEFVYYINKLTNRLYQKINIFLDMQNLASFRLTTNFYEGPGGVKYVIQTGIKMKPNGILFYSVYLMFVSHEKKC